MRMATVTESKNGLSELRRAAKAGHGTLILDRDVPVARIEPVSPDSPPDDLRLRASERQGLVRRPREVGRVGDRLKALPKPRVKPGRSAVAAVLAERAEGR